MYRWARAIVSRPGCQFIECPLVLRRRPMQPLALTMAADRIDQHAGRLQIDHAAVVWNTSFIGDKSLEELTLRHSRCILESQFDDGGEDGRISREGYDRQHHVRRIGKRFGRFGQG